MQAAQRRWKRQGNGFCSGALDSRPPALWENDCVLSATRLTAVSDNSPRNRHGLCPVEAQVTEQGGGGGGQGLGTREEAGEAVQSRGGEEWGEGGQLGSGGGRQDTLRGGGCWVATGQLGPPVSGAAPGLATLPPRGQARISPLGFSAPAGAPAPSEVTRCLGQHSFLSPEGQQEGHTIDLREAESPA